MIAGVPPYFTSLKPFAGLFVTGMPWLMYHKLGSRPRGVRLKGLFVSRPLFVLQLSELQRGGFNTPVSRPPPAQEGNAGRKLALTFDDGFANVFQHGLEPLAQHGLRAMEFQIGREAWR